MSSIHKEVLENIGQSLQAIRTLRTNVEGVFESLVTNGSTSEENKANVLLHLQELLNNVNNNLK